MGCAKKIVYRFEGKGIADQMAILDCDGDALIPDVGDIIEVDGKRWTVGKIDVVEQDDMPAYIVYLT
jgi:hypothetical protein